MAPSTPNRPAFQSKLGSVRMRETAGVGVKKDFQCLFRRFKNLIAHGAFCEVLRDFTLNRWRKPTFEIIADQPDCFLACHNMNPLAPRYNKQFAGQIGQKRYGLNFL